MAKQIYGNLEKPPATRIGTMLTGDLSELWKRDVELGIALMDLLEFKA